MNLTFDIDGGWIRRPSIRISRFPLNIGHRPRAQSHFEIMSSHPSYDKVHSFV
jgi:hypothetical protein